MYFQFTILQFVVATIGLFKQTPAACRLPLAAYPLPLTAYRPKRDKPR